MLLLLLLLWCCGGVCAVRGAGHYYTPCLLLHLAAASGPLPAQPPDRLVVCRAVTLLLLTISDQIYIYLYYFHSDQLVL